MIQYKKVITDKMTEETLNELGAENWDNYNITGNGNVFWFKRKVMSADTASEWRTRLGEPLCTVEEAMSALPNKKSGRPKKK